MAASSFLYYSERGKKLQSLCKIGAIIERRDITLLQIYDRNNGKRPDPAYQSCTKHWGALKARRRHHKQPHPHPARLK